MTSTVIAQILARQIERPDIHRKVEKLTNRNKGYPQYVADMVHDLKEYVPEASIGQLAAGIGISRFAVFTFLDNSVEQDNWTTDDNEASAAAELAALQEHHGSREYEDHEDAKFESDVPIYFSAPVPSDAVYKADQSHTIKRPITLATMPFSFAA